MNFGSFYKIMNALLCMKYSNLVSIAVFLLFSTFLFSQEVDYEKLLAKMDDSLYDLLVNKKYKEALAFSKIYTREAKKIRD